MEKSKHTIITFTEITTFESQKNMLKQKAYFDDLTKVYNRAYFEEKFNKEKAYCNMTKKPLSFIILDVDNFKNINDTYGHQVGDDILYELAQIVQNRTRHTDIFARWGGEEFVMILPNTDLEIASKVAEDIRAIIASHVFSNNLAITCSFGVSLLEEKDTKKSIVKRADDALYRAKLSGKNRVEC